VGSGGCHAGVLACPPVFPHLLAERDLVRDAQRHIDRTPRRPRSIGHLAGYVIVDTSARTYYIRTQHTHTYVYAYVRTYMRSYDQVRIYTGTYVRT